MKKFLSMCLAGTLGLTLLFTGCSKPAEQAPASEAANAPASEAPTANTTQLKVALVMPGPINDGGWNALAYKGLQEIKDQLGAETSYSESVPASSYEETYRTYATTGFNLIIGHGFEFNDVAKKVAKDFPNVKFVVTSSDVSQSPNVGSLQNNYYECGYLQGIVAAGISKTGKIAAIGGMDIPPISVPRLAYEAAAKSINPKIEVTTVMTGSFDDVAKAKETALSLIEKGADVIMGDADQAGFGIYEACKAKGAMAIGSIADQSQGYEDTMVTSGLADISKAMLVVAQMVKDGTWEPKYYPMGVEQDVVALAPYKNFDSKVPQEVKDKVTQTIEDFKSGKLNAQKVVEDYKASKK